MKFLKKLQTVLFVILMLMGCVRTDLHAQDNQTDVNVILFEGKNIYNWDFPYSDDYFNQNPYEYHHSIARISLGLAVASIRQVRFEIGQQESELIRFFEQAGFENSEFNGYDEEPGEFTISEGIASKKIDDYTLIAIGVCGGGYKTEWISNLTSGADGDHVGFRIGADKILIDLDEYINKHNIEGKIKIWISGYSRAAAVSNLAAADMTDSNKYDAVFGYFFATPNNTLISMLYDNIYNIRGKNDPVPKMPLSDWGFSVNGHVLYTPAPESDSDYIAKKQKADVISRKLLGRDMTNSPIIASNIRIIFSYMLELFPNPEDYEKYLQEPIKDVIRTKGSIDSDGALIEGLTNMINETEGETQEKAQAMLSYVLNLGAIFSSGKIEDEYAEEWVDELGAKGNFIQEHQPYMYLCWLFSSDNPDEIYSDNTRFERILASGVSRIEVYDKNGFVMNLKKGGILQLADNHESKELNFDYLGSRLQVDIPRDESYLLVLVPEKSTVDVETLSYNCDRIKGVVGSSTQISDIKDEYIFFSIGKEPGNEKLSLVHEDGEQDIPLNKNVLSTTEILDTEDMNIFHISIGRVMMLLEIVGVLLVILLLLMIFNIVRSRLLKIRKNRGVEFAQRAIIVVALMILHELSALYGTNFPIIRNILMILVSISVGTLCKNAIELSYPQFSKPLMFAIWFGVLGSLAYYLTGRYECLILLIVSNMIIVVTIWKYKKPDLKSGLIWALLTFAMSVVLSSMYGGPVKNFWITSIYFAVYLAEIIIAGSLGTSVQMMLLLYSITNIRDIWERYYGYSFSLHITTSVVWCVSLFGICAYIFLRLYFEDRKNRKITKEQKSS